MVSLRAVLGAVLVLVLVLGLAGCGTGPPDHVRLGVIAPQSGPRAALGQELVHGARLAIADLNDAGGLLGHPVELVVVDDADLVALPAQLADLAEVRRVTAVIGPESPGPLLGPRSPLTRRQVPALLPSAFTGTLDDASTFVARTVPSAGTQAAALGDWLTGVRGIDRIAILVADPLEGSAVLPALRDGFAAAGIEVVTAVEVDGDVLRLDPAVATLRARASDAGGVGAVMLWGPPAAAARATRAVRDLGWDDVQLAVGSAAFVAEYRSLAGVASEGVVLPFPFRPEWFGTEMTQLLLRYHREIGLGALPGLDTLVIDVPVLALAAYDATHLVAAAVAQAGTREPAAVAEALRGLRHDGVLTEYDLDAPEIWAPEDLYVARFHAFATVYDVDPRLDRQAQQRFWQRQVSADYLPEEILSGPAGALLRPLLERARADLPTYVPPQPAPSPVGSPDRLDQEAG